MLETLRLLELVDRAFHDAMLADEPLAEALGIASRRLVAAIVFDPLAAVQARNHLLAQADRAAPGIAAEELRRKAQLIDLARSGGLH